MATIFHPDGNYGALKLPQGHRRRLAALQRAVGGPLGIIAFPDKRNMIFNNDADRLGLPENERATEEAAHILIEGDSIKGPAVLCGSWEFD